MSVLMLVSSLWGVGHLARIGAIAAAATARGLAVTVVNGGRGIPGLVEPPVRLIALPPLTAADAEFSSLLTADGRAATPADLAARAERVAAIVETIRPRIIVLETWPFGRRALAREFEMAVAAGRALAPPALILTSVRDVLVAPREPARFAQMAATVRARIDRVLVHTDPDLIAFGETFPYAQELAGLLHATGYVVRAAAPVPGPRRGIVVACGGGAGGFALAHAAQALAARRPAETWCIVAGPAMPDPDWRRLLDGAGPAILLRADGALGARIAKAEAAIARAGYNTVMETLAAGTPLVMVPFGTAKETEQRVRARRLSERGLAELVEEEALDGGTLAAALDRALARGPAVPPLRRDGAAVTAALLARWLEEPA